LDGSTSLTRSSFSWLPTHESALFLYAKSFILPILAVAIGLMVCSSYVHGNEPIQSHLAGPFVSEFAVTIGEGTRTEAFGPFFYMQSEPDGLTFAVPPLFSKTDMTATDSEEFDLLYPLLTFDRYGRERRWQVLQLLNFSAGQDQSDTDTRRLTLFPIYFQQRSEDERRNYTALFPLLGRTQNRFGRSELEFALWPLWVKTTRRNRASDLPDDPFTAAPYRFLNARRGDVTTFNVLYPFFHYRMGEGLRGWQFWPLYGHEEKLPTLKTNDWGDVITLPGHRKDFALWPIWYNQHRGIGTTNQEHAHAILPFYAVQRSPARDSTSYLWPIGVTVTEDRARKYREVDAPWPFIVFARGEGKTANRIWPLYSHVLNTNLETRFILWPIYKQNAIHSTPLERVRHRILFFLYDQVTEINSETGKERVRRNAWPLFTYRKDFQGNSRLQLLAPLEPLVPGNTSVERNYSPLWSLWRSEKNPAAGKSSQSLLWNLYRNEKRGDARKCSLLFGLFQYQSTPETKRVRVLFIPFGRAPSPAVNEPHAKEAR
jgi:hypothetical protein